MPSLIEAGYGDGPGMELAWFCVEPWRRGRISEACLVFCRPITARVRLLWASADLTLRTGVFFLASTCPRSSFPRRLQSSAKHAVLVLYAETEELKEQMKEPLDIFGQNPRLSRLYTSLCLCFELPDDSGVARSAVVALLENGLRKLGHDFPWTSGQVLFCPEDGFYIGPAEGGSQAARLVVKHAPDASPSFKELKDQGFPFHLLPEAAFAPRKTLPELPDDPAEVFLMQVNFVRGGVLLVINGQHNCMDMAGQVQVIRLLSKACRDEPFSPGQVAVGNASRKTIIPLLQGKDRSTVLLEAKVPAKPSAPAPSGDYIQATWAMFLFSGPDLAQLKTTAMQTVSAGFVSTDDVLSAFLWQAISRVKLHRLGDISSSFQRQVDVRSHLRLPDTYPGMAVQTVSTAMSLRDVVDQPLGVVASRLREQLSEDIGVKARRAATLATQKIEIDGHESSAPRARDSLPSGDIKMSSWAKEDCYNLDFGSPLHRPSFVRRPDFPGWEGLAYLLPKKPDGEIAAALCLREADLNALRSDQTMSTWARYVG